MQPNATVNGSNAEIYVLNLATKVAKRLTNSGAADYTPHLVARRHQARFASSRTGKFQIYTMNSSTGGSLTKITDRPRGAFSPA